MVVLLFWTSLLVRTSAWTVLLQQHGLIKSASLNFDGTAGSSTPSLHSARPNTCWLISAATRRDDRAFGAIMPHLATICVEQVDWVLHKSKTTSW